MTGASEASESAQEIFRLEVASSGLATLCFDLPGSSVNLFTRQALEQLGERIEELRERDDIGCLVLLSGKAKSFCHGADVELIGGLETAEEGERGARAGQELFRAWQELPFPTIAAIHATCMGGATEISLASTFRLVSDDENLRVGLPEVRLGILPGWGGCVRLPRVVGLTDALDLILAGKSLSGARALRVGLADELLPHDDFLHHVRNFALEVIHGRRPRKADRDLRELLLEKNPLGRRIVFDQARKKTLSRTGGKYPAPLRAIEVIRIGVEEGPAAGFDAEARALGELAAGVVSKNLQHVFALTQGVKSHGTEPAAGPAPRLVGVVGAGLMGGAIAHQVTVSGGMAVRILDRSPAALVQSMTHASRLVYNRMKRRRISRSEAREAMARIQPTLDLEGFRRADLVIEAVTERLEVKRKVFGQLAEAVSKDALLASNTSSLSIDAIAETIPEPERVLGLHFFNPVHRIPLVEVVAGRHTAPEALKRAAAFVRRLGKTPVAVQDSPGFLVNRVLIYYLTESLWLIAEGWPVEAVDRALLQWGFPMGPFALLDRVGLDIAAAVSEHLEEAYPQRVHMPKLRWQETFLDPGHLGEKSGRGFFRHGSGGKRTVDGEVYGHLGLGARDPDPDLDDAAERLILPMINEAACCLEEGVVDSPETLDLAMILGAGFPPFRGGLCRWADHRGLDSVVGGLERLAGVVGERFRPSDALRGFAAAGGFYRT
ncbi:MAG: 3-hydroxyacyl-CoA dehydrogenase NAD-binding domain-containing protein [Acidobacteriota bacterium]|nr:3-hydroxyacyl-CoA dehydrogenase NAD-binding domain-containing protein [Acidobacteriota bacterium]